MGQGVLSGIDTGNIQDSQRTSAVLDTYPLPSTVLGVAWEDYESDFAPYERSSVHASWDGRLDGGQLLHAGAEAYRTRFSDLGASERGASLDLAASRHLTERLYWETELRLRTLELIADAGRGLSAEAALGRRFREVDLLFGLRYTSETFDVASDQDQLVLTLTATRSF